MLHISNKVIYFHIGLHKTGTTFLQKNLFPQLFNNYNVNLVRVRNANDILDGQYNYIIEGVNFVSTEEGSGNLRPKHMKNRFNKFLKVVEDFESNGFEVKIILFLRNYNDWLKSAYIQLLKTGHINKKTSFSGFVEDFLQEKFYWSDRINLLQKRPILLVDYEIMKTNFQEVLKGFNEFITDVKLPNYNDVLSAAKNKNLNISPKTYTGAKLAAIYKQNSFLVKCMKKAKISRDVVIKAGDIIGFKKINLSYDVKSKLFLDDKYTKDWLMLKQQDNIMFITHNM